jgi:hypothetical protein
MTMCNEDDILRSIILHVRCLQSPNLGNQLIDPSSDLGGGLSFLAAVAPDIPASFLVQAMGSSKLADLVGLQAIIKTMKQPM